MKFSDLIYTACTGTPAAPLVLRIAGEYGISNPVLTIDIPAFFI